MPLLLLAYLAFLGISLPDGLLGVSWPSMSVSFGQPVGALGLVLPFAVVSSILSSASTAVLLTRIGLGRILAGSTGLYALALSAQSLAPAFWVFIVAAVGAGRRLRGDRRRSQRFRGSTLQRSTNY